MQLIIGKKAILDAITNKSLVKATISNKDKVFFNKVKAYLPSVQINNDKSFYEKLASGQNHQFAIGYVEGEIELTLPNFLNRVKDQKTSLVLIVDSIEDPMNFGAIIRSAESFGIDALIYKKDGQCQITPAVIKTSQGAISNLNMIKVTNLNDTINKLKEAGYWIYASCLDQQAHKLDEIKFSGKVVIIVGNENKGVSPLVLKNSDFKVYIEMFGKSQSLNVSAATAVLLSTIQSKLKK
ncbi:MAG: 23S rRNA (guanosine(2251)-2'-O)-methyltransferase RlmB [Mycoplasma sp.]|nr:23S rRNA (guanosine(2251)-2'-O)-methyltransferase RlmB [Candidatus Hennigella equi]